MIAELSNLECCDKGQKSNHCANHVPSKKDQVMLIETESCVEAKLGLCMFSQPRAIKQSKMNSIHLIHSLPIIELFLIIHSPKMGFH